MSIKRPILLAHWGDPAKEFNEILEIQLLLSVTLFGGNESKQRLLAPTMSSCRIQRPDVSYLRDRLRTAIRQRGNLQILYLSAHGNKDQLCFDNKATSSVSYKTLGEFLGRYLRAGRSVHVILGSCGAMSEQYRIERVMPKQVYCISGFTQEPTAMDVSAHMVSVIEDDVSLFQQISKSNAAICNGRTPFDSLSANVRPRWLEILKRHKENPLRRVLGSGGGTLIMAKRDTRGNWRRRTITCMATPPAAGLTP